MASYNGKFLCFFFLLYLSFSIQTQARDSNFFSKFTHKGTTKNPEELETHHDDNNGVSPTASPAVVERGYGLYGGGNYQYPPMTVDPVKTGFVSKQRMSDTKFLEKQGMSDTRFLESGKYYYDVNNRDENNRYETENQGANRGQNAMDEHENEYVTEKQGMSDTRFLENGKYYYDVNNRGENYGYGIEKRRANRGQNFLDKSENEENRNVDEYVTQKQGMSDNRFSENGKYYYDGNNRYGIKKRRANRGQNAMDEPENEENRNVNEYVTQKQGMSDTRSSENGRFSYDVHNRGENYGYGTENRGLYSGQNAMDEPENEENRNVNEYVTEKQGMSDTRFLENGRYYYDVKNENKFYNRYDNNNYENDAVLSNNGNGYENGYSYDPNEYTTKRREGYNGNTKKLPPNQYDSMEEYDKEEDYRLSNQQQYVP